LWKGFTVHLFQCRQDLSHFFAGVPFYPAVWFELIEAAEELLPRGLWLIENLLQGDRVSSPGSDQAHAKRMIVL
jgi:hypothetical protein